MNTQTRQPNTCRASNTPHPSSMKTRFVAALVSIAILAPLVQGDAMLERTIAELRAAGETVVASLPGARHGTEVDRGLVLRDGRWQCEALTPGST